MTNTQYQNTNILSTQGNADAWYRLQLFNYFRALLALCFITVYLNDWVPELVPGNYSHTGLFITVSVTYLLTALFFTTRLAIKKPGLNPQVIFHTLFDIACITLLMHATGGVRTGLGMLLIISISMTSLFLPRRLTLLFAAIATLSIIAEQVYSQFVYINYSPAFTQAGLLGILIFISAFLATYSARRLKESEKRAEETRAELETIVQMNEHIIKNMRTGILVIKNDGQVLMANNAALELLGQTNLEKNTTLQDTSIDLYQRFLDWNDNAIQNHKPIKQTHGLPDIQPGFSHIDQNSHSSNPPQGRTLIFIEDATKLAQRFQQVKLASLGQLTASIAHEIRNPLAAINHAGQLLAETSVNAADKKLTGIINTHAKRLNNIVENVLQLSRQQRGVPETINIYRWLLMFREEFVATHNLQAYQLRIAINPPGLLIVFDSNQLHQVMWNLCSNAINHSNMENSNIMISIQGEIDKDNLPYIDIIDNGPGIDEETQNHIFDPFFTTSSEGTGLGLYITKEVIESNRANIRLVALPTGDTCFRIHLQLALEQPQTIKNS